MGVFYFIELKKKMVSMSSMFTDLYTAEIKNVVRLWVKQQLLTCLIDASWRLSQGLTIWGLQLPLVIQLDR